MLMPAPDERVIARRDEIAARLRAAVPDGPHGPRVIADEDERRAYECDGLSAYRQTPFLVALPDSTAEVAAVLRICGEYGVKVVPRGSGTSLSGGALPTADALVLGMGRFNRILDVDYANRAAVVQPGVTNLSITQAVQGRGFFYAPDPSSQLACSIGGNVATNSGGAHCLKYGVTANNLLGLEMVTMDGEVLRIGGKHLDAPGYDLLGLITGSEGMFGVVTEVTVRLLRAAEGARPVLMGFASNEAAGACVADIIGSGIVPVALEFMDKPAIHATEQFAHAGYPLDVEAMLICEVEGSEEEIDFLLGRIAEVAARHDPQYTRVATTAEEAAAIWKGRKAAFGAVGRISPDYYCMDGTIPTGRLPEVLRRIAEMAESYRLGVANIFHAGDGNLHPLILYDANDPDSLDRAERMGAEVLTLCVEVGGCLTGEHGVGVEKRDLMRVQFDEAELEQQRRVKQAFDPAWLLNPAKVLPLRDA